MLCYTHLFGAKQHPEHFIIFSVEEPLVISFNVNVRKIDLFYMNVLCSFHSALFKMNVVIASLH